MFQGEKLEIPNQSFSHIQLPSVVDPYTGISPLRGGVDMVW